jgi:hypothetical protein
MVFSKLELNRIAERWPAKAVVQFSFFKAVAGLSLDSIVKVLPKTNFLNSL